MITTLTKELLDTNYNAYLNVCYDEEDDKPSKYAFLSHVICDLTTYDDDLDERFGIAIAESMKTIIERKTFEYIKNENNYVKYILSCQIFIKNKWIDWGVSIRSAWFNDDTIMGKKIVFGDLCKTNVSIDSDAYDNEGVSFNTENVGVLLEWLEETK